MWQFVSRTGSPKWHLNRETTRISTAICGLSLSNDADTADNALLSEICDYCLLQAQREMKPSDRVTVHLETV